MLSYMALSFGIFLYFCCAFHLVQEVRRGILLWGIPLFILVGLGSQFPTERPIILNFGILGYVSMFCVLFARTAYRHTRLQDRNLLIAIATSLASVTIFSLVLDVARIADKEGVGRLYLADFYERWFAPIQAVRISLLAVSVLFCLIAASHETTEVGLDGGKVRAGLHAKSADYAFVFFRIFWRIITSVSKTVLESMLTLLTQSMLPWFAGVMSALCTMWTSRVLFDYLSDGRESPVLAVAYVTLLSIVALYAFGYLEFTVHRTPKNSPLLSISHTLRPYWRGAATDAGRLLFHLSWLIPATMLVLLFVSQLFGIRRPQLQFGYYSVIFLVALVFYIAWGGIRRMRKSSSPATE